MERPSEVEGLTFPQFQHFLAERWAPGEHWAVVAPTGEGKTVFIGALAKSRRYVLGLDIKGGDKTLSSFGWPRVKTWPLPYKYKKEMRDNERLRVLIGGTDRTRKGRTDRRALLRRVLEDLMADKGWTVLCPDLMALCHRDLGQADAEMRELLILARDADVSLVTDWQRPANVPVEAGDQATYLALGYTRDKRAVERLSEMIGRSYAELRGAMVGLSDFPHGFLIVSRRPRDPLLLTKVQL